MEKLASQVIYLGKKYRFVKGTKLVISLIKAVKMIQRIFSQNNFAQYAAFTYQ